MYLPRLSPQKSASTSPLGEAMTWLRENQATLPGDDAKGQGQSFAGAQALIITLLNGPKDEEQRLVRPISSELTYAVRALRGQEAGSDWVRPEIKEFVKQQVTGAPYEAAAASALEHALSRTWRSPEGVGLST